MLTFKPFTTLLNITLNKPTLCYKTSQICWCWSLCRKPFVSEHAQCEGLRSPKGLPLCSDTTIVSDGSLTLKRRNVLHTLNYTNHKTTASKVALVRKNHVTYYVRNSNCFFLRMNQLSGSQRHARNSQLPRF